MPERRSVKVIIYNQQYSMLAESDPSEVEELASAVDSLIRSISSKTGSGDLGRIATGLTKLLSRALIKLSYSGTATSGRDRKSVV